MEINASNIKTLLKQINVSPDKNYGQNFLINPAIASSIVDFLDINEKDFILEIGPGLGSLSHYLFLNSNKVDLVDIDENMYYFLKAIYKDKQNNIYCNDIRKFDISKYNKIISNLPYNLTSEIILYLLKNGTNVKKYVLMCEFETFNHFFDTKGKEYGPLSVYIHLIGNIKKLLTIKPSNYYPMPKCKSVVFSIDINVDKDTLKETFNVYKFVKNMFLSRRKTIFNNLSIYLSNDKEKCKQILEKCKIDLLSRSEEISPEEFLNLYKEVKKLGLEK